MPGNSKDRHDSAKQGQPRATGRCEAGRAEPPYIWPRPSELVHNSAGVTGSPVTMRHVHSEETGPRPSSDVNPLNQHQVVGDRRQVTRAGMGTPATEDPLLDRQEPPLESNSQAKDQQSKGSAQLFSRDFFF